MAEDDEASDKEDKPSENWAGGKGEVEGWQEKDTEDGCSCSRHAGQRNHAKEVEHADKDQEEQAQQGWRKA